MAEDLMRSRSGEHGVAPARPVSTSFNAATTMPDKTVDALWNVHRREVAKLRSDVQQRAQECEQMRGFVRNQATQANATILEMARRNLELEQKLSEACRHLEEHGLAAPTPPTPAGEPAAVPDLAATATLENTTWPAGNRAERRSN